jgi:transposase
MTLAVDSLPRDLAAAHAMIIAKHEALLAAEARASAAESEAKHRALLIEKLKHTIAKLRHEKFGQSSERGALLEQLELALADLQEDVAQAEATAEMAAAEAKVAVHGFERRRPARRPLPEHLPRERIVYPVPAACPCCGGVLHKIGEDVTETLEVVPRQWKVIQHVREKFSCRSCESVAQPPAPSPGRGCSPRCCSPNIACTCRSTGRARPMPGRASSSRCRRWRIGSAPVRRR